MSALLHWLGGGGVGSSLFVLLNVSLLYGSFALLIGGRLSKAVIDGQSLPVWRLVLAGLLLLNPVIFVYSGIVWKDVLFASSIASVIGILSVTLAATSTLVRWLTAVIAIFILSVATLVRQQGLVVATPLLIAIIACALSPQKRLARFQLLAIVAWFVLCLGGLSAATDATIIRANDRGFTVGFQNVMDYDVAGTVYQAEKNKDLTALQEMPKEEIPQDVRRAIIQFYSPYRIDFLLNNPVFAQWAYSLGTTQRIDLWAQVISRFPLAYLKYRLNAFAALLGVYGVEQCLPVHVGISGNGTYLKDVGLAVGRDSRSQLLYRLESNFFRTPFFWHWFESTWLVALLVIVSRSKMDRRGKIALVSFVGSGLLLLSSYLPTSIACDYRYLFALVPIATLVSLWLLLNRRPPGFE
jgi:hypothetical protein